MNIKLPIKGKKILANTKRICLKIALTDARRRLYKLKEEKAHWDSKL